MIYTQTKRALKIFTHALTRFKKYLPSSSNFIIYVVSPQSP